MSSLNEFNFEASFSRNVLLCAHETISSVRDSRFSRAFVCFDCDHVLIAQTRTVNRQSSRKTTSAVKSSRAITFKITTDASELLALKQALASNELATLRFARARQIRTREIVATCFDRALLKLSASRRQALREADEYATRTLRADKRASLAFSSSLTRAYDRLDDKIKADVIERLLDAERIVV